MKNLLTKFLLAFALLMASITLSEAQLLSKKKMPVAVKTYSFFDESSKFEMEFKDYKGSLDKYNFYNLDNSLKDQKLTIVFDRKTKEWRLPLTYNEAVGIAEKDGEEPLQRLEIPMSIISPAIREKIH
jgi:hypothetical protein